MKIDIDDSLIGKPFYFMYKDKIRAGLISGYHVDISFKYSEEKGMWASIFGWWLRTPKEKPPIITYGNYEAKLEVSIYNFQVRDLTEKGLVVDNIHCYWSKEDLLKTI